MNAEAVATHLSLQPDGKILVAGTLRTTAPSQDGFAVARLGPDGRPDESFGTGGVVRTDFGDRSGFGGKVLLQQDGKILVTGSTYPVDALYPQ